VVRSGKRNRFLGRFGLVFRKPAYKRGRLALSGPRGDERERIRYIGAMTAKNLEEVMERVRHWPRERQEDAAAVLLEMEWQDKSGYRLTDAQAQEVTRIQRQIREGQATFATDEQMAAFWKSCGL
jgi:chemotaxis regulatin CheY-phosphate phosphatase CheZ